MISVIKKILLFTAGLLWPETCPFCGKVRPAGSCKECNAKLKRLRTREPVCMRCGKPVMKDEQEYCYDCLRMAHYFNKGVCLWVHSAPVSTSIYRFKYHNQRTYGFYYAEEFVRRYAQTIIVWKPDVIIPIPLHKKRKRKRGYNQSALLAEELGKILRIAVDTNSLLRVRNTKPQKQVMRSERKSNIYGAFSISPTFFPVKTALIVDDIYTTGNTINEAARLLRGAGVQNIYFLAISIGQGN